MGHDRRAQRTGAARVPVVLNDRHREGTTDLEVAAARTVSASARHVGGEATDSRRITDTISTDAAVSALCGGTDVHGAHVADRP